MSNFVAGFVAGIPLAVILGVEFFVRRSALVAFFQGTDESLAKVPEKTFFYGMLACAVSAAFMFGAIASLVHGWLGTPVYYYVAFGAAIVLSVLAVISKQPLPGDKIIWNLAVGGVLGVLIPLLAG